MVNIYAPVNYKTSLIIFNQQVSALSQEEQLTSQIKRSRIEFVIPGIPQRQGDTKILYKGNTILIFFTEDKILISFKGKGFPGEDKKA